MEKSTTNESQYARSLIEASLDPLFTINPAGKITDMNNASVNTIGMSREKWINLTTFNYTSTGIVRVSLPLLRFSLGHKFTHILLYYSHQISYQIVNLKVQKGGNISKLNFHCLQVNNCQLVQNTVDQSLLNLFELQ
jgi:hypothetical protein